MKQAKPIVWTIAGSDSSGGAGLQADLKTFNALGVHGCSLTTAFTAQNSRVVLGIDFSSENMIEDQWETLIDDLPPATVKVGMPGTRSTIEFLALNLFNLEVFKVVDPVLSASTGTDLIEKEIRDVFNAHLLPAADLLTPNIPEAETVLDRPIASCADMEAAAHALLKLGPHAVLLKGGHREGPWCQDYWTNGTQSYWLTSPRIDTPHTHGTGCVLSSAVATCKAWGYHDLDAIVIAKAYVNQGLHDSYPTGEGKGTLAHEGWPHQTDTLPWLTLNAEAALHRPGFPDCGPEPIGLYPIVDRAEWLEKLLPLGIKTIQLRIKDLTDSELEREIKQGIEYARGFDARLFINDQWEFALKYKAYGLHIGQDDLEAVDLQAIENAGLRLGISTHSYTEIARALAYRPSYIALGTLFKTTSKTMNYPPLGLDAFKRMCPPVPVPVVAIGGIRLDNAVDILKAGADGIAVISDIKESTDLPGHVRNWLGLWNKHGTQPR